MRAYSPKPRHGPLTCLTDPHHLAGSRAPSAAEHLPKLTTWFCTSSSPSCAEPSLLRVPTRPVAPPHYIHFTDERLKVYNTCHKTDRARVLKRLPSWSANASPASLPSSQYRKAFSEPTMDLNLSPPLRSDDGGQRKFTTTEAATQYKGKDPGNVKAPVTPFSGGSPTKTRKCLY